MAEDITLARPYGEAVFSLARDRGRFAEWSDTLGFLAQVVRNPEMAQVIGNPKLTGAELERLVVSIGEGRLDDEGRNFVALLVRNGRLPVLPQIQAAYEKLREEQQGIIDATIESAFPLTDPQRDALVRDLEQKFHRTVHAKVTVDPALIGGVRMVLGDVVIDSSVRGQLEQMAAALKQ